MKKRAGAALAAQTAVKVASTPVATSSNSHRLRPLMVALIGGAALLLALGAVPARYVPWRRAALVIENRHLDFALVGIALLAIAAFAMLLTRA